MEELQAKYQRLGQEYQKARAQITVLKKAVLDEQEAKNVFHDGLKQRDQTIRKYEQEIDSLHFRNSQLSKRVEILQNELSEYENRGVKPSKTPSASQTSISFIHEQELQMKIAENESLHKQLRDVTVENKSSVKQLERQLEEVSRNEKDYKKLIDEFDSKNNLIIQKLQEERHMLDSKLNKQTEDLKIANALNEKYKSQFKADTNQLQVRLDNTKKMMQERLPFIDSCETAYNLLNVPICDKTYQQETQLLMGTFSNQFISFLKSFSDYHTYLEQRLQVFNTDINQKNASCTDQKFFSHLLKNAVYSRELQNAVINLQGETSKRLFISIDTLLTTLQDISTSFRIYANYLDKLLPYREISIEEECRSSTWSGSIEKFNHDIINIEKTIVQIFSKLSYYIEILLKKDVSHLTKSTCFLKTSENCRLLNGCFKRLHELYSAKAADEHAFSTYTERLKTTDDFLLSTVASLEVSSGHIFRLIDDNSHFYVTPHQLKRKGITCDLNLEFPSEIDSFNNNAANYMQSLLKPISKSSPYVDASQNAKQVSNDDMFQQINASHEQIIKLEQEKEHWIFEHKLLTAKFEKELKKSSMVKKELQGTDISNTEDSTSEKADSEKDSEETIVKEYMSIRILDLTKQLQNSDSKGINFYQEAHSLYQLLILADKNKQKLNKLLVESQKKVSTLQDELETTKRSYEEQLGMFSDHLCGMNDKLTSQKDQIDELKTSGSGVSHNFGIFQLPGRKK